ncbi:MAG: hypothetical protein ABR905_10305 [Terracidiphilus sp.]|jgi:hypothetical protein
MSLLESMRKGLNFFLLVMGVSAPAKKPQAAPKPTAKPHDGQP